MFKFLKDIKDLQQEDRSIRYFVESVQERQIGVVDRLKDDVQNLRERLLNLEKHLNLEYDEKPRFCSNK